VATSAPPALLQFSAELKERWIAAGKPAYARIAKLAAQDRVSISQGTISNLMSGKSRPRWDTVQGFVRALRRHEDPECDSAQLMIESQRWRKQWGQLQIALATKTEPDVPDRPETATEMVDPIGATTAADARATSDPVHAEAALRQTIFDHLRKAVGERGTLTREELWNFTVNGEVHRLIDRSRGIRNPREMLATLSIISRGDQSFSDEEIGDSLFSYAYRDGTIDGDNQKLRRALELKLPLILLRSISNGVYVPIFPIYVVGDDPVSRRFVLSLDNEVPNPLDSSTPYSLSPVGAERNRIHGRTFRAMLLRRYGFRCAICGLGVPGMLQAAHIVSIHSLYPEASTINNGLVLCANDHLAFDSHLLGITPDYKIQVSRSIMDRGDDPAFRQLRDLDGRPLCLPPRAQNRPSAELLAEAFKAFEDSEIRNRR
jgi:putative restriction endonuclease